MIDISSLLNQTWPEWELMDLIGAGQYGKVYRIKRESYGHVFEAALKVVEIPSEFSEIENMQALGMDSLSIRDYFSDTALSLKKEIDIMQELKSSANIVTIEDSVIIEKEDQVGWNILIRMELLESLRKYTKTNTLETEDYVRLGIDMCSAITDCEKAGIIHRDIKPENIFVNRFGAFKLGDFGIARKLEKTKATMSKKGTELYMAPEVIKGDRYDSTVDIYSLGIMLYRFLNKGRMPFYPPYPEKITQLSVEEALIKKNRGVPFENPCDADEELCRIIKKACAYNPGDRYQSAADMKADLTSWEVDQRRKETVYTSEPVPLTKEVFEESVETQEEDKSVTGKISSEESQEVENEGTENIESEVSKDEILIEKQALNPKTTKKKYLLILTGIVFVVGILFVFLGNNAKKIRITDISGEGNAFAILKSDGTVLSFGSNHLGAREVGDWTDIQSISTRGSHTVGLKKDGTVVAVGENDYGECNVDGWTDIVAVETGYDYTVGLKSNGTVVLAGDFRKNREELENQTDIIAVSAINWTIVVLKSDGTAAAYGDNLYGECDVNDWTDLIAVSTGPDHTVGLKKDGTVVAVGNNAYGECNVQGWTDIIAVAAGDNYTIGLKSDKTTVFAGDDDFVSDIKDWTKIKGIAGLYYYPIGIKSDGTIITGHYKWNGMNLEELEKDFRQKYQHEIKIFEHADNWEKDKETVKGKYHFAQLKSDGTVSAAGFNYDGQCEVSDWDNIVALSASDYHTVGLRQDGTVVATGDNSSGQCNVEEWTGITKVFALPEHTTAIKSDGTLISTDPDISEEIKNWRNIETVVQTNSSISTIFGIKSDGTVVSAGGNYHGEGDVEDWTDIVTLSAGREHTVGLKSDGTVVATGDNEDGECDVEGWTDIAAIAAGDCYTIGIQSDGTVLFTGARINKLGEAEGWTDISDVCAEMYVIVGLKKDGTVITAGLNFGGECNVEDWQHIIAVSGDDYENHTVGITENGTFLITENNEESRW